MTLALGHDLRKAAIGSQEATEMKPIAIKSMAPCGKISLVHMFLFSGEVEKRGSY